MKHLFITAAMALSLTMMAQSPIELPLYPNGAPDDNGLKGQEVKTADGHYRNVYTPSMFVFHPDKAKNTGAAVVICPGGGYGVLAFEHEGIAIAEWLAENGITGIVLKYRMPNGHYKIPLEDVHTAMTMVREKSAQWGILPQKIGIMGSSAGGHLASTAATHFTAQTRPDFAILFYPVITMHESFTHMGSRNNLLGKEAKMELVKEYCNEEKVTPQTPPTLLLLADDDKAVVPQNSVEFYMALKRNNVPASMYIFPEGAHGFGFRTDYKYHADLKRLILEWIKKEMKIQ